MREVTHADVALVTELYAINRARQAMIDGVCEHTRQHVHRLMREHASGARIVEAFDQCRAAVLAVEAKGDQADGYARERHLTDAAGS